MQNGGPTRLQDETRQLQRRFGPLPDNVSEKIAKDKP